MMLERARISAFCTIIALLLAVAGCGDREPGKEAQAIDTTARIDTTALVSAELPAGRFQIPTSHTPVSDFFITLPDGYTIRNLSRLPNDEFFIIRTDDPGMTDSTAVTPGFMRLFIGVSPQTGLRPGQKHTERNVVIAGFPLVWNLWTETVPDGSDYYIREITSADFFSFLSPELAKAPLHLHLYVAGNDSTRVAELMSAAETLSLRP